MRNDRRATARRNPACPVCDEREATERCAKCRKNLCGRCMGRGEVECSSCRPDPYWSVHEANTRRARRNPGRCPVCNGPGYGMGDICMGCVRARAKTATTGRGKCSCGSKKIPGPEVSVGGRYGRAWIPCERCLGSIRQTR